MRAHIALDDHRFITTPRRPRKRYHVVHRDDALVNLCAGANDGAVIGKADGRCRFFEIGVRLWSH